MPGPVMTGRCDRGECPVLQSDSGVCTRFLRRADRGDNEQNAAQDVFPAFAWSPRVLYPSLVVDGVCGNPEIPYLCVSIFYRRRG